ncbi:hypothetical protein BC628DRAFT_1342432 [Trametes gibbosa]|nr:hypothetical protein BC628DRAFT_1342432 [Trametes gibbosa]
MFNSPLALFVSTALFLTGVASAARVPASVPDPNPAPVLPTTFPFSNLDIRTASRPNTTLTSASHQSTSPIPDGSDTPALLAFLWLCEGTDCGGECSVTNLGGIQANECTQNNPFVSAMIQQVVAPVTPYEVVVGPRQCPQLLVLPAPNECFNLSGAFFEAYAVIE